MTDSVSVTLLRGEEAVHLMLANLPGVSYESAPRRFRETRSTILDCQDFLKPAALRLGPLVWHGAYLLVVFRPFCYLVRLRDSHAPLYQSEQVEGELRAHNGFAIERRSSVDQKEFNELHASCVGAFGRYAAEAEKTAFMLANCTAEPMPLPERLKIVLQESIENTAHSVYLSAKLLLHEAARLGYAFTD